MANMPRAKRIPPVTINKFLGLNEAGEIGLKLGEASIMQNFRITPNFKLKKREGWKKVLNITGKVRGMWHGKLNGITTFLFCANGHLYSGNLVDGIATDIGTLTDAPTRFIHFKDKVYLNNGYEYKSYDGTTFKTVEGYRPKVFIGTPPSGGGTPFEETNVLTGAKHQTFSGDGTATEYQLVETNINSVDFVKVNGADTSYTADLVTGKITFAAAPGEGQDNVDIGWTKGTGERGLIEKCRFSMDYSGKTNSRVFLWGNKDHKSRRFWSGLADKLPSAEYFETSAFSDEGNGQYAITDIVKQYDTQKIFLERGARYSMYEATTIEGRVKASFPTYELNDEIGNAAEGQVQIVNNNPFTIYSGVRAWKASTVKEQFNQELISERVQKSLDNQDLTKAVTINWQEMKEYWLCIGNTVWVHNYSNNTWYRFDNISATCFIVINGELYFGSDGYIGKFDKDMRTDEGVKINDVWEMGFYDFEAEYLTKFMNNIHVSIQPARKTRLEVRAITNNEGTGEMKEIFYNLIDFGNLDFNHFSFETSYNPQPFYVEMQCNGFVYLKLRLTTNSEVDTVTVLSIVLPARYGGKVI